MGKIKISGYRVSDCIIIGVNMKTTEMNRTNVCPYCGKPSNMSTSVNGDASPSPGDISVCFYCGEIGKYNSNLNTEKISPFEMQILVKENPVLQLVMDKILKFRLTQNRRGR